MPKRNGTVVFADRNGMGAGKGDFPRNISDKFRENLDKVDWTGCKVCGKGLCDHEQE